MGWIWDSILLMPRAARFLVAGSLLIASAGCASIPPAQMGQAAGTIAGATVLPGIGAPIGALAGTLLGMLMQKHIDQVTETHERKELGDQFKNHPGAPAQTAQAPATPTGPPTRVWVEERVVDGRLVSGHFDVAYLDAAPASHVD